VVHEWQRPAQELRELRANHVGSTVLGSSLAGHGYLPFNWDSSGDSIRRDLRRVNHKFGKWTCDLEHFCSQMRHFLDEVVFQQYMAST
jgi:hypothetical protein